ncbi:MAG TPA: DUF5343 domain-containing protein [Bdellovibrio sp.]|uniref:DUF5343 domain-containing protein n=1 Tax=Bdellovibrio sp. TaxID=28201 RepID=UPI002F20785F
MSAKNPPFINSYNLIPKILEKIQQAQVPERFTQDYLATKLGFPGGSAKAALPFLKRIGFLGSDGVPTEIYKRFRNKGQAGYAIADAIKQGYEDIFEVNEYAQDLGPQDLKNLIVQLTGLEDKSVTVGAIVGSFNALKSLGNFDKPDDQQPPEAKPQPAPQNEPSNLPSTHFREPSNLGLGMNLAYNINIVLPETTNPAVFNAIFKSINENLLKK